MLWKSCSHIFLAPGHRVLVMHVDDLLGPSPMAAGNLQSYLPRNLLLEPRISGLSSSKKVSNIYLSNYALYFRSSSKIKSFATS